MSNEQEVWKPIARANKTNCSYEISSLGHIRNTATQELQACSGEDGSGYCFFRGYRVHRLAAEVFLPNPENKLQVNHINGIKSDNHIENLEWATHAENCQHAHDTRLNPSQKGRKLSDEQRLKISEARLGKKLSEMHRRRIGEGQLGGALSAEHRQKVSKGATRAKLAAQFNIGYSAIKRLLRGEYD